MGNGKRKYLGLKIVAGIAVVLVASLFIFRAYLIRNIHEIIHDFVVKESKGEYQFQVSKVKFDFLKKEISLYDCILLNVDTATHTYQYSVTIKELRVSIVSLMQIIVDKFVDVKSIYVKRPEIQILEASKDTTSGQPFVHTMGDVYQGINKLLKDLEVDDCQIEDALLAVRIDPDNPRLLRLRPLQFGVKNFSRDNQDKNDKFLFTEDITLRSGLQHIVTLDSLNEYSISRFSLSTKDRSLILDSCTVRGKQADTVSGSYDVFFRRLELFNIDFSELYHGKVKIDSVHCYDPDIQLFLNIHHKEEEEESTKYSTEESIKRLVKKMFGDAKLGYIGFSGADINVTVNKDGQTSVFNAQNNNFGVKNLRVDPNSDSPLQFGAIDFAVKNYSSRSADSIYTVSFDSIWLKNNDLFVNNFRLQPDRKRNPDGSRDITVPELQLKGISASNFILTRKVFATEAILKNATIRLDAKKNTTGGEQKSIKEVFASLRDKVSLKSLKLENAKVHLTTSTGKNIEFENLNSTLAVDKLLSSSEINAVEKAMDLISFSKVSIRSKRSNVILTDGLIDGVNNNWTVERFFLKNRKLEAEGKNLRFSNILMGEDNDKDELFIDSISWQSGRIILNLQENGSDSTGQKRKQKFNQLIHKISLSNTELIVNLPTGGTLRTYITNFLGSEFTKPIGESINLASFTVDGHSLVLDDLNQHLAIDRYFINDNKSSFIRNIKYDSRKNGDTIKADISAINFVPIFPGKLNAEKIAFTELNVQQPVLFARMQIGESDAEKEKKSKLQLAIKKLVLAKPKLDVGIKSKKRNLNFYSDNSELSVNDLIWDAGNEKFEVGPSNLILRDFTFSRNDSMGLSAKKGKIELGLKKIFFHKKKWRTEISNLDLEDVNFSIKSKKKGNVMTLQDLQVDLHDLVLNDSLIKFPRQVFMNTPNITIDNINTEMDGSNFRLICRGGKYTNINSTFKFDSVLMIPKFSKEEFIAKQKYQKDYLALKTGKVIIHRINPARRADDTVMRARNIEINDPVLTVYKDKRLPVQMDIVKPMPVNIVKGISSAFIADSIQIKNATVTYTEYNNKTKKEGTVHVNQGNAIIRNIRNRELSHLDSMSMSLSAYIEDSAFARVIFRESYVDSLAAGILIMRVSSFNLPAINSFLEPIAGARVRSGHLDTLHLKAVAREYVSLGEAQMIYDNLKIDILKKEDGENKDAENKTESKKLLSFIANLFVKKENQKGTGMIFVERSREKFIVNYWIKILLSGISTNVGIKTNKKVYKKYKRQIKKLDVPEISM